MLPWHTSTWGKWIEVLLFSSHMQSHVRRVKDELCRKGEWESLSIDTSYKLCLTIIGQNAFNTPEAERDAPIAYDEAAHGIASMKGKTGALAGLRLVYSEGSTCIVEALTSLLTPAHLATVVHVCVDDPSPSLRRRMQAACNNFRLMSWGPMHFVFRYESGLSGSGGRASKNRRSQGSNQLRGIMKRFGKPMADPSKWIVFDGDNHRATSKS